MNTMKTKCLLLLLLSAGTCLSARAIGGDGAYFVQTFEELTQYPESKTGSVEAYQVEGQGEWLYLNAFQATNASYIPDGSAHNLRLPKSGSYVVTPVLGNGVARVTFDIGRASVVVYTSADGGATWSEAAQTINGKKVTVDVGSTAVNRIKVANDTSKDADIDNLAVYAQTFDTPVTLSTGEASDITTSSATVAGSLLTTGNETVTEVGIVWSTTNKVPDIDDNSVAADAVLPTFTCQLTALPSGRVVYYRAYAKYADTQCYGDVKSFKVDVEEAEQTVDAQGRYFVQDFEDLTTYPEGKLAEEQLFYVKGQGEWIYYNAFQATNASYIPDGSAHDLRMPKNGSYVVTPILGSGVKSVTFDIGRKAVAAYLSTDGGNTWTAATIAENGTQRIVNVESYEVNRIKLANDTGSDADIDNLTVYAQAFGTPATVATGGVYNVTKNTAEATGEILDGGDQPVTECGIIWSAVNKQPSLGDNVVTAEETTTGEISVFITGLKASQTVYYRAYARSNAGYAYGEVKSFQTAEATLPTVQTGEVTKSGSHYKASGVVTDDGGLDLTEVGIVYGTVAGAPDQQVKLAPKSKFAATLQLADATTYYIRAYATTAKGTAYGEEISVLTDEVVVRPDEIVGDVIWCSPDGDDATADGSEQKPFFDVQKAIDLAEAGDRIWMKAGTYVYDKRINIDNRNGTPEAPIQLFAYGGRAVLDFSGMPYHKHSDNPYQGVRLTSSYWHFYKIDICNASDNGMLIERNKPTGGSASDIMARTQDGHDNIIEQCNFYRNGDTGLQIKNLGSYNYVINCDSYENADESDGDADGFAPKISVGDGNYFYGCRAWNNSDDGYDVFFKKDGGFEDNKTIIMEYCLAYENGIMNGSATSGNGNGFKMGSDQGRMNVVMNRCLAVRNLNKGFDQNHNSGDIIMNNCTGIGQTDVGGKSYSYRIYEALSSGSVCELTNCVAINDRLTTDRSESDGGKRGTWGRFEVTVASLEQTNDWKCAPENFMNMDKPEELISARQDDGTLPEVYYAHIDGERGAALIDAGTVVNADDSRYAAAHLTMPAIEYAGSAPDLGAYETNFALSDATMPVEPTTAGEATAITLPGADSAQGTLLLTVRQTRSGLLLLTANGAGVSKCTAIVSDASGRQLCRQAFNGTTAVRLPQGLQGVVVVTVEAADGSKAVKKLTAPGIK